MATDKSEERTTLVHEGEAVYARVTVEANQFLVLARKV
jgi:hypothetical protein